MPARGVEAEWYVPAFGPRKFRLLMGVLSLPHTAMVVSFTVLGAMAAPEIHWGAVAASALMFLLGLGLAAHLFDAVCGPHEQSAGALFRPIWLKAAAIAFASASIALSFRLWPGSSPSFGAILLAEFALVAAYSLNWFNGKFRSDTWRAVSWGFLPVIAGYIIQAQTLTLTVCLIGVSMTLLSRVVITAGRSYAAIKQARFGLLKESEQLLRPLRQVLTGVSTAVILLGVAVVVARWIGA
jgi:hypothetical protein